MQDKEDKKYIKNKKYRVPKQFTEILDRICAKGKKLRQSENIPTFSHTRRVHIVCVCLVIAQRW